jgi:hypothetical protein
MKALTFHFSYPRFVAGKMFGGLSRGGPLVYDDVPDAKLLGDDWVIVETRYCGICGSDVKQAYLVGAFDNPMTAVISFPHVLGHEVVGTVVEAGKDVRRVKKGDRVACYPWITCAVRGLPPCAACAAGDLALCQNFTGGRWLAYVSLNILLILHIRCTYAPFAGRARNSDAHSGSLLVNAGSRRNRNPSPP